MRRQVLILALASATLTFPALAQQQSGPSAVNVRDKIELTRSAIEAKRTEILQEALKLTPQQSEVFWPVYREYENEIAKLGDQKARLLQTYALNYEAMSEKQADDLLDEWFKLRGKQIDLQQKYKGKFRKALPAPKVVRLFQVETLLDAVITGNLQAALPLAEEAKVEPK